MLTNEICMMKQKQKKQKKKKTNYRNKFNETKPTHYL